MSESSTLTRRVESSYCLPLTVAISFCGYEPHLCGVFLSVLSVFELNAYSDYELMRVVVNCVQTPI